MNPDQSPAFDQTCEVLLEELLTEVPDGLRIIVELNPTHHRMIPVGKHCHAAAKLIRELKKQLDVTQPSASADPSTDSPQPEARPGPRTYGLALAKFQSESGIREAFGFQEGWHAAIESGMVENISAIERHVDHLRWWTDEGRHLTIVGDRDKEFSEHGWHAALASRRELDDAAERIVSELEHAELCTDDDPCSRDEDLISVRTRRGRLRSLREALAAFRAAQEKMK